MDEIIMWLLVVNALVYLALVVSNRKTQKIEKKMIEVTKENTKEVLKVKRSLELFHKRLGKKDDN